MQFIEEDTMREDGKIITFFCVCFTNCWTSSSSWSYRCFGTVCRTKWFRKRHIFLHNFSSKTKENSIIKRGKKTQDKIRTSVQLFLLFIIITRLKFHFVAFQSAFQTSVEWRRAVCTALSCGPQQPAGDSEEEKKCDPQLPPPRSS